MRKRKKPKLLVELTPELRRDLQAAARKHEWSMAKVIRQAVREWIDKEAPKS